MSVVCIEVEHGSPINNAKFEVYKNLWWHLDEFYWELHLLVSDRWGNLTPVPVHRYTSLGTADIDTHRLGDVIAAERSKNEIMFELSGIYCIADKAVRETQRAEWIQRYPTFTQKSFLENRSQRDQDLSV